MSFSFDVRFLKLADKADMDEISNKFKNWPDMIINLSYIPLIAEKACLTLSTA